VGLGWPVVFSERPRHLRGGWQSFDSELLFQTILQNVFPVRRFFPQLGGKATGFVKLFHRPRRGGCYGISFLKYNQRDWFEACQTTILRKRGIRPVR